MQTNNTFGLYKVAFVEDVVGDIKPLEYIDAIILGIKGLDLTIKHSGYFEVTEAPNGASLGLVYLSCVVFKENI